MKIFYKPAEILSDIINVSKEENRMKKGVRTVVYDDELHIEAYRFEGIVQPFPNHFHEYYVVGFMEDGTRALSCKKQAYTIKKGDVLLFNPGDSHACVQNDGGTLDYRGFNIDKEVMLDFAEEVTGRRELPGFSQNVLFDEDVTCCLRPLHELVMKGSHEFGKEEFIEKISHVPESALQYLGVAICGAKKKVNKLTGSMPLLR